MQSDFASNVNTVDPQRGNKNRPFIIKVGIFTLWFTLVLAGGVMGLAAVSSITTKDVPLETVPEQGIVDENIQTSFPSPVQSPSDDIVDLLIPLPLSGGKTTYSLSGVALQLVETQCGVERVLAWSKPGGEYCAITIALSGRGRGNVVLKAKDQAIYSLDASAQGYRGSFFLDSQGIPLREILIQGNESIKVVLVIDSPEGFVPARALIQESAMVPVSE